MDYGAGKIRWCPDFLIEGCIPHATALNTPLRQPGGYVYRGNYFSDLLYGAYVFADFGAR